MAIELKFMKFIDKELNIEAEVTSSWYHDNVAKFVKFCVCSNKEFRDTKIILIRSTLSSSDEKNEKFLSQLKEELKSDNNVIFILKTSRERMDLSNVGFSYHYFDNKDYLLSALNNEKYEYYICDHAEVNANSLIYEMQKKFDSVNYKCFLC